MAEEIYKDYYDYEVSNYGKVRCIRKNKYRYLKQRKLDSGFMVTLKIEGKWKTRGVHRLVYHCFVGELLNEDYSPHTPMPVIHIDHDNYNNYYENLKLVSVLSKDFKKHTMVIHRLLHPECEGCKNKTHLTRPVYPKKN